MAGRAGRPQFDDQGVCVVMTRDQMRGRYERMLAGTETIESQLHEHQLKHLNAEIAYGAGTYMSDISVCLRWLKSTFLFTRIKRNPEHCANTGWGSRWKPSNRPLPDCCVRAVKSRRQGRSASVVRRKRYRDAFAEDPGEESANTLRPWHDPVLGRWAGRAATAAWHDHGQMYVRHASYRPAAQ